MLAAGLLLAAALPQGGSRVLVAKAATAPTFWIETDNAAPKTGDSVTVTFYVSNNDTSSIMSFNGKITFNPNYFKYDTHSCPAKMNGKVLCYDDEDVTSSSVGFSYADPSGVLIRGGDKNVAFFSVTLTAVNTRSSAISISAAISMCTVGTDKIDSIMVQPVAVTLGVTTAPPPTTTTTTYPRLTTTTTLRSDLSAENRLKSLSIAPGTLSPGFSSDFYGYNVELPNEISTIRIDAVPMSDKAIIVGGSTVNKDLQIGYNYFTITVRAENGEERSYSLIVRRLEQSAVTTPTNTSQVVVVSLTDPITPPSENNTVPTTALTGQSGITPIKVEDEGAFENGTLKIVGIIAAVIALFFFGFISGYLVDKGMKEKKAAERVLREREKVIAQDDFMGQQPIMQPPMQVQMQQPMQQYNQMPMNEYVGEYDTFGNMQGPIELGPPEDDYYN